MRRWIGRRSRWARSIASRGSWARRSDRLTEQEALDEVSAYTLALGDADFLHQHVVDAWAAEHADASTPPTKFFFAVAGLCLLIEHGFTGRAIQRAHATLAGRPETWPLPPRSAQRSALSVIDVAAAPAGAARNRRIVEWAGAVWAQYAGHRGAIEQVLRTRGII